MNQCPDCGSKNLIGTSQGIMCKDCKCVVSDFAPIRKDEKEEEK